MKGIRFVAEIAVFALILVGFVANAMSITSNYKYTSTNPTTITSTQVNYK